MSRYRDPPLQVNENYSYLAVKGLTLLIALENATDADIMLVQCWPSVTDRGQPAFSFVCSCSTSEYSLVMMS